MKKYIIASSFILVLLLYSGIVYGQASDDVDKTEVVTEESTETTTSGVEVKYIFKQELKMVFEGESMNWNGSYFVEQITNENGEVETSVKVVLKSKNYKDYRWINYEIKTSNETIKGKEWLIFGEEFCYESDEPLPEKDEQIEVRIKQGNLTEIFYLECVSFEDLIPVDAKDEDIITADEAVELLKVAYFNASGVEMPDTYTIYVEFEDGEWVVSYDDNDGIGGRAYLRIKSKISEDGDTGEDEEIKIQE